MENEKVGRLIREACEDLGVPEEFQDEIVKTLGVEEMGSDVTDLEKAQEAVVQYCKEKNIKLSEPEPEDLSEREETPPPEVKRPEKSAGKKRITFKVGLVGKVAIVLGVLIGLTWVGIILQHRGVALVPAAQIDQTALIQMKWKEFINDAVEATEDIFNERISKLKIRWPPDPKKITGQLYSVSEYFALKGKDGPWDAAGTEISGYLKPLSDFFAALEEIDRKAGGKAGAEFVGKKFEEQWGLSLDQKEKLGIKYTPSEFAKMVVGDTPAPEATKELTLPTPAPVPAAPSVSTSAGGSTSSSSSEAGGTVAVLLTTEPTPVPSTTPKATAFPSEVVLFEWNLAGTLIAGGKTGNVSVESIKILGDKTLAEVFIEETGQTVGVEITTTGVKKGTKGVPEIVGGVARINWIGVPTPVPQPTLAIPPPPTAVPPVPTKVPTHAPVPTAWRNPPTPTVPAGAAKNFSLNNVRYDRNEAFSIVWTWWQDIVKTSPDSGWINNKLSEIQSVGKGNLQLAHDSLVQKVSVPTIAPKPTKTNYPTEKVYSESGLIGELIKHGENDWCSVLNVEQMRDGGRIGQVKIGATGQIIYVNLPSSVGVGSVGSTEWSGGQKVMKWR